MIVYLGSIPCWLLATVLIAAISLQQSGKPWSLFAEILTSNKIAFDEEGKVSFFCWKENLYLYIFWVLVLFLEALTFSRRPDKTTIVVEGVNSTNVDLIWEILPGSGEVVQNLFLIRQRSGDVNQVQIASRKYSSSFNLATDSFANEYRANLPATLRLLNVDNTEEYVYTLQVSYELGNNVQRDEDRVTVIVHGKSNSFAFFLRRIFKSVR